MVLAAAARPRSRDAPLDRGAAHFMLDAASAKLALSGLQHSHPYRRESKLRSEQHLDAMVRPAYRSVL